jgi:hypothetical protein
MTSNVVLTRLLQVQVNGQARLDGGQIGYIVLLINYEID